MLKGQIPAGSPEPTKLVSSIYYCRNCRSGDLEVFFQFPETFFWYGLENSFLEKNIVPKNSDAVLFLCNFCGFIASPVSERLRDQLNTYYESPYSVPGATPGEDSKYSQSLAESFFSSFAEFAPGWIPEKVLEIGCQRGYLLNAFRLRGSKVTGVEPGLVEPWIDESGFVVDIRRGVLSRDILNKEIFDFIYCLQVLEHVEDPNEFLEIIYDSLRMGGKFCLAVPNELFSFKEGNVGMFLFQHLNYFTPETIQALLEKNGFKIKGLVSSRCKELMVMAQKTPIKHRNLSINSATRKSMQSLLRNYQKKVSEKLDYIRALSDHAKKETLGFYGVAGTSNIFSWIPELLERPVAVFDSDSFTWEKRFGGVPSLVQPPEELNIIENVIPVPFRLHDVIVKSIEDRKIENLKIHSLY